MANVINRLHEGTNLKEISVPLRPLKKERWFLIFWKENFLNA